MQLGHQRLARVAQRQADDAAVRRVVTANDETLADEAIDDRCSCALPDVEFLGELAHCHRLTSEVRQHAELMAGDGMKLVAQLSVQQGAEALLHLGLELAVPVDQNLARRELRCTSRLCARRVRRCLRDRHHEWRPPAEFRNVTRSRTFQLMEYSSR